MAPRIIRSLRAESDLTELFAHIAADTSPDRAEAVLLRIGQTLNTLSLFPGIGRVREDLDGSPRVFAVWPWVVIYEPMEDGDDVFVWRVVDGRRDLTRLAGRPRR